MTRDTVIFDINETVLDLSSLKPKFEIIFGDSGVIDTWFAMLLHTSTVCALTGVKTGFASLAGIVLDAVAVRRGLVVSSDKHAEILSGFASLKPHSDIRTAIVHLRSVGYRTVAFSNSSLDLVTNQIANARLSELFDEVVSVEETGSFKPDSRVYEFVAERLNRPLNELRLVATHDWDTHGAMAAGMLAAYIDRSGAPYHPLYQQPDVYATDMNEVVEQIIRADTPGQ
jgi:2-haloacid dehalogenase